MPSAANDGVGSARNTASATLSPAAAARPPPLVIALLSCSVAVPFVDAINAARPATVSIGAECGDSAAGIATVGAKACRNVCNE